VPVFARALQTLDGLLDKGGAQFAQAGRPEFELTESSLIGDMLPLSGQIQRAGDTAKGVVRRFGGEDIAMPDPSGRSQIPRAGSPRRSQCSSARMPLCLREGMGCAVFIVES